MRKLFGGTIPVDSVLAGVASAMAKVGVTVVVDPHNPVPCASPKEKRISLPATVQSEQALNIVRGWLDHEAGHIIYTPDSVMSNDLDAFPKTKEAMLAKSEVLRKATNKAIQRFGRIPFTLFNAAEDARIESLMVQKFPGSLDNFKTGMAASDVVRKMCDKLQEQGEAADAFNIAGMHMLLKLGNGAHGMYSKDFIRDYVHPELNWVLDLVDKNYNHIREIREVDPHVLQELADVTAAVIVEKVLNITESEDGEGIPLEAKDSEDGEPSEDEKDGKGSGKDEKGEKCALESSSSKTGSSGETSDEEEGGSGDSEGDSDEEAVGSGEAGADALEDMLKDCFDKNAGVGNALGDGPSDTFRDPSPSTPDPDPSLAGMPEKYLDNIASGTRIVILTGDELLRLDGAGDDLIKYANDIRSIAPRDLGAATRLFIGRFNDKWGLAFTGKRIAPKKLASVVAGKASPYEPIMLRRSESALSRQGVAVILLIDFSGSMTSSFAKVSSGLAGGRTYITRLQAAQACGLSLARLLEDLRVKFEVLGFTTTDALNLTDDGYGGDCSRMEDCIHVVMKPFEDSWAAKENNMLVLRHTFDHVEPTTGARVRLCQNADGEAVMWAASRLISRQEERKILIVLSDGEPAVMGDSYKQSTYLKWATRQVSRAGIRIGGLGVGYSCHKYYNIHVDIGDGSTIYSSPQEASIVLREGIIKLLTDLTDMERTGT
jgi:hypothetical protein